MKTQQKPKNVLHFGQRKHISTTQSAWSDDCIYEVPFDYDVNADKEHLKVRIYHAVIKKYPPRHYAGCGYGMSLAEVKFDDTTGKGIAVLSEYNGIGD